MSSKGYKFDFDLVKKLMEHAESLSEVAVALGYSKHNTRYRTALKKFCEDNDIEIPKFARRGRSPHKLDPKDVLISGHHERVTPTVLRRALLLTGVEYTCSTPNCGVSGIWKDKMITLHIDHINGNETDNRIENLRLLCPNCHSQTDTYGARNSGLYKDAPRKVCHRCNEVSISGKYCRACQPLVDGDEWHEELPTIDVLVAESEAYNASFLAKKYGVSIDFIKNRIKYQHLYDGKDLSLRCDNKEINPPYHPELYDFPPVEEILSRLSSDESYVSIAKSIGCSDNAVRKYLVRNGIIPPKRRK